MKKKRELKLDPLGGLEGVQNYCLKLVKCNKSVVVLNLFIFGIRGLNLIGTAVATTILLFGMRGF